MAVAVKSRGATIFVEKRGALDGVFSEGVVVMMLDAVALDAVAVLLSPPVPHALRHKLSVSIEMARVDFIDMKSFFLQFKNAKGRPTLFRGF